jgi:hypothetical protein
MTLIKLTLSFEKKNILIATDKIASIVDLGEELGSQLLIVGANGVIEVLESCEQVIALMQAKVYAIDISDGDDERH